MRRLLVPAMIASAVFAACSGDTVNNFYPAASTTTASASSASSAVGAASSVASSSESSTSSGQGGAGGTSDAASSSASVGGGSSSSVASSAGTGGAAPQCLSPADCGSPSECQAPTCVAGSCGLANLPTGKPCAQGLCDQNGACVANIPIKCKLPDNTVQTCADGMGLWNIAYGGDTCFPNSPPCKSAGNQSVACFCAAGTVCTVTMGIVVSGVCE